MVDVGDRVLPELGLRRNPRTDAAAARSHVAMGQLVPRPGKGVRKLGGVLVEASGDGLVDRVDLQGQVRRQHHRGVPLRRIVGIRHRIGRRIVLRRPLVRAARALRKLPVVAEQVLEEVVVPLRGCGGPGAFQAARDRVAALAGAEGVPPAETLLLEAGALGFDANVPARIGGAVSLAEGVSAGDQGHRLFVVHRHAAERLANVPGRGHRIGGGVRAFRIHVDQTHLHRAERILELPVARVALVTEPRRLGSPVDVLLGLPYVLATTGETERPEPHRLQGAVAGEDHQVGPRQLAAVLLLDRPQETPRLVQAHVVRPTVERREAERPGGAASPPVADPVRSGGMPRHADEERPVVAVVGRPPLLRGRHHIFDVLLQFVQVDLRELLGVVEVLAHRVRERRVLVEDLQVQLVRPPALVRDGPHRRVSVRPGQNRALACGRCVVHAVLSPSCSFALAPRPLLYIGIVSR